MSDCSYVKCDGCGSVMPDPREESWHRMHVAEWVEVIKYDNNEGENVTLDFCKDCWNKMLKAVE